MHTIVLQDWTTIQGATGNVIQSAEQWADLMGYKDVGIYIEASTGANSPSVQIETSPTRDDAWFKLMTGASFSWSTAYDLKTAFVLLATATQPLTRYVRWRASGGSTGWSLTFRVVLVGNPVG